MAEVGGLAHVEPVPGGGTLVRLQWNPPMHSPPDQVTPYSEHRRLLGYVPVAVVPSISSFGLALRHLGAHPWLAGSLAVVCATAAVVAGFWFAHRPARPRDTVPIVLIACAVLCCGLMLAGNGGLLDFRSWVVGFAAVIVLIFAFDAPVWCTAIAVAAQMAVLVVFAWHDPTIGVLEPVGALMTPVVDCSVAAACGALLRKGTRLIQRDEAVLAAHVEDQAWQQAQGRARVIHLKSLHDEVAPFFEAVIAGTEPAREEAGILAERCRDELTLPCVLPASVREAVDDARRDGVHVTFRIGDESDEWPAQLDDVIVAVLSMGRPQMVTVLPGNPARVAVIPAVSPRSRRELADRLGPGCEVVADDLRMAVTVSPDKATVLRPTHPIPIGA